MDPRFLQYRRDGHLSAFDLRMAAFLCGLVPAPDPSLFLAAALVSRAASEGDACLDLAAAAGRPWPPGASPGYACDCPPLGQWCAAIRASGAAGTPGERRPLVLDPAGRLYFFRYWDHERELAEAILARADQPVEGVALPRLKEGLARLFPSVGGNEPDWQAVACAAAVLHRFAVISGGPGTGKTRTVAAVLALLLEQPGNEGLRVCLCAPTGKAAARLSASIQAARQTIPCEERVRGAIPERATTIHRLLGAVPGSSAFRHDRGNPLPFDVVVVDEASMVDLALMSRLARALLPGARLILVGDRDQLASVEAGAVLGDICDRKRYLGFSEEFRGHLEALTGARHAAAPGGSPGIRRRGRLADGIVVLRRSYRFGEGSGIGRLARRVNAGDAAGVLDALSDPGDPDTRWQEAEPGEAAYALLAKHVVKGYRDYLSTGDPGLALERFERFRILCAVRAGPFGVDAVNGLARRALAAAGLLPAERGGADAWYGGRPVLIVRNDYELGLFNGDMGIAMPDPGRAGGEPGVFFPAAAGSPRRFEPFRLSSHETVFAMTVHKSQGSEFDDVLLVLPDRDCPVLTRELIYTAVTRARRTVTLWGRRRILAAALARTVERASGLRDRLWGAGPGRI